MTSFVRSLGVSLWLVPAEVEMDRIRSCLPRRPPSDHSLAPSSYPALIPHITLATIPFTDSGVTDMLLDTVPKHQELVRSNFQSLVVGDHYFRSVFIDIEPTRKLVTLQDQISTNLRSRGLRPSAPRFPHMSLCYISDEDESERDRMARSLRETGVVSQTADPQSISLQCGDDSLVGFDGVEIWVVKCDGGVETWEVDERKLRLKSITS